jgi:hypothetical protein
MYEMISPWPSKSKTGSLKRHGGPTYRFPETGKGENHVTPLMKICLAEAVNHAEDLIYR